MTFTETSDRLPLVIRVLEDHLPGSAWLSPSRSGKTTAISLFIKKFTASAPAEVFLFDPKAGSEFVGLKDLPHVHVLSPDQPEEYLAAIKLLHDRAKAMADFKAKANCTGSFQELWWRRVPGSGAWSPTIICVDEFVEQVEVDKGDDDTQKALKAAMRNLLQKALRRYAGSAFHTILASQSSRASDRALLGTATDSVSFTCYGRADVHMADSLKLPMLSTDRELHGKGVFYFRSAARTVKFYAR